MSVGRLLLPIVACSLLVGCGPNLTAKAADGPALRSKAQVVKKGMTESEVTSLIGEPDLKLPNGFIYKHEANGDDALIIEFQDSKVFSIEGMFDYKRESF